jgi:nicotinate phosphoribosyltransferase
LDEAGLPDARILVSGGLDEYDLERLARDVAPIDAAGVGTPMGVSADAPSLDSAYKVVTFGDGPVLKLSAGKSTLPGAKQVWRRLPIDDDVLASRDETAMAGREPLLAPVMEHGVRVGPPTTISAARACLDRDLATLPGRARDLHEPAPPAVRLSAALTRLTEEVSERVRREAGRLRPRAPAARSAP